MFCPVRPPALRRLLRRLIHVLVVMAAVAASDLAAAEYHVSPHGDDAAPGTLRAPWRTLAKVNATVAPGDTVVFHDGRYAGAIAPHTSGQPGTPIVYRAASRHGAVVTGDAAQGEDSACVRLVERAHVVIDGFFLSPDAGRLMLLESARHCVIRNTRLENATIAWEAILMRNSHNNRFEDLECGRTLRLGSNWGHVTGDLWDVYSSSGNVWERIHFHRTGHHPLGLWHDCERNVVRQCVFEGIWGRNFEFASPSRLLVEQCVVTQAFDGSNSADGRAKFFARDAIFRRNLIHHNYAGPMAAFAWARPDEDSERFFPVLALRRSRFYHNTWVHNFEPAWRLGDAVTRSPGDSVIEGNVFQNEIYAWNDRGADGVTFLVRPNIGTNNVVQFCNLFGGVPGRNTVRYLALADAGGPARAAPVALSTAAAARHGPMQFRNNLDVDPEFVDADGEDYRLAEGSPLIDAGHVLTRTAENGRGRIMRVEDARWFYDGFGIPGEQGDLVIIGADRRSARVVAVDGEFNTLTFDRDVAWRRGEVVTLPYAGAAPDIGAYEHGAESAAWYRAPRAWNESRIATMATAEEVVVQTTFEPEDLETWFYFWNFGRRQQSTAVMETATAAQGRRCIRIQATGERSVLGADIRPAEWDLDRFPTIRFAYRVPPGVPVGLWLQAFPDSRHDERRICIGGSATRAVGHARDLARVELNDDDRWHVATIDARIIREVFPDVVFLQAFAFFTDRNGDTDDAFWFDDFSILPANPPAPSPADS